MDLRPPALPSVTTALLTERVLSPCYVAGVFHDFIAATVSRDEQAHAAGTKIILEVLSTDFNDEWPVFLPSQPHYLDVALLHRDPRVRLSFEAEGNHQILVQVPFARVVPVPILLQDQIR